MQQSHVWAAAILLITTGWTDAQASVTCKDFQDERAEIAEIGGSSITDNL